MEKPHPESLLQLPLVAQMLKDPNVRFVKRAIDRTWNYEQKIPISVVGFNPLRSSIYYGSKSCLAQWLRDPSSSARKYNEGDALLYEVLFSVHDYLHIWAFHWIHELRPDIGFGYQRITEKNFEDFVFCHLLTEAVATVGLDYWYLSTVNLNEVCDIGTNMETLTVNYHERHLAEYRRFNPKFAVQEKKFFKKLAKFYMTGIFHGFEAEDLRASPRVLTWLKHELSYGETQREYTRMWLSFLSDGRVVYPRERLGAPVSVDAAWKTALIEEISDALWSKVKEQKRVAPSRCLHEGEVWTSSEKFDPDFRFINANRIDAAAVCDLSERRNSDLNFKYYFYQRISGFDYEQFDHEKIPLFKPLFDRRDAKLLNQLLKGQKMVSVTDSARKKEPRDLFVLN